MRWRIWTASPREAGGFEGSRSEPQDSSRAWAMAWTLGWTEMVSWGILYYAFSVLLVPMQNDFGWSNGAITGAYSLALLISGVLAPSVGRYIDRNGARAIMTAGSILGTVLLIAWSQVDSLLTFYLVWIGMGVAFAGTLYDPAFAAIAPWFRKNRGKAMLIITFLGGLASTIFFPVTGYLEEQLGWRDALLVLAGVLAIATILPHWLVIRPPGQSPGDSRTRSSSSWPSLIRSTWFRRLSSAFFLQSFTSAGVTVHMIAYLIDRGVSPTTAAWTAGLIGAAQTGARVMVTLFENKASAATLTSIMFATQMVAIILLVAWPSGPVTIAASLLLGIGKGALTLLRPAILLEHYSVREFGGVNGSLASILNAATAAAPVVTGLAVGWFGGYTAVFAIFAVMSLASAVILLATRYVSAPTIANAP